jgi:hypothetical protein
LPLALLPHLPNLFPQGADVFLAVKNQGKEKNRQEENATKNPPLSTHFLSPLQSAETKIVAIIVLLAGGEADRRGASVRMLL